MLPPAQVSPGEVQKIVAGMDDPSELQAGGVHLGGTKYMFIQSDDRMVAGKKVRFCRISRNRETSSAVGTSEKNLLRTASRRANRRLTS